MTGAVLAVENYHHDFPPGATAMIPEMQAIQANLALGLITEREAEELCFLVELVDRDYRLSAAVNREMGEPKAEMEPLDGNCPDFRSFKRILPLI